MLREGLVGKIKLLSKLQHKFIVAPTGIVQSKNGKPIGFCMPFSSGEPLPRVFTNDFRVRTGFDDKDASVLVHRMREVVQFAHSNRALLIDANEMNWLAVLAGNKGPEPRVIDVDSWAIGQWSAKVIMPSIRDWHAKQFDQNTDWFAWGIVTFQIYTGIHPYKGKLVGFKPSEMEKRMKAQEMYLLKRLENEMCTEQSDAVLVVSLTVNKSTAIELIKTWYGEQVLTKEDILSCGSVKASPQ